MVSIVYVLISIGVIVLNIILIVKFWGIANDVSAIREMMASGKEAERLSARNVNDPAEVEPVPTQQLANDQRRIPKVNLEKGKEYDLGDLGLCTYEGMYNGKHGFYPVKEINKSSIYFHDDVDPYYLIPESDLGKVFR